MLHIQHLIIDTPVFKCCFSSIMKHSTAVSLGALLTAILVNSCATPGMDSSAPRAPSGSRMPLNSPVPEERPGLATGWGNERKSELINRSFVRASAKPAGTDAIFYNDSQGIKAMSSRVSRVAPMQTAAGGLVEWGIKGGAFLTSHKEWGHGRRMVAGEKDKTYSIVVKNRCKSALEIVASVDGLDVQDGKSASFSKRGYVVEPGDTLEIEGFRTSYSRVAAFKFSGVSNSYANMRHGDTRNVGVIGIAVFTQKDVNPWMWMPNEVENRLTARPFATAP
jgi:hypothetical protein